MNRCTSVRHSLAPERLNMCSIEIVRVDVMKISSTEGKCYAPKGMANLHVIKLHVMFDSTRSSKCAYYHVLRCIAFLTMYFRMNVYKVFNLISNCSFYGYMVYSYCDFIGHVPQLV